MTGRYAICYKLKQNDNDGCNSCASLAWLVLCFIACFILLVIAPLRYSIGSSPNRLMRWTSCGVSCCSSRHQPDVQCTGAAVLLLKHEFAGISWNKIYQLISNVLPEITIKTLAAAYVSPAELPDNVCHQLWRLFDENQFSATEIRRSNGNR